jgi:hypothetical protein
VAAVGELLSLIDYVMKALAFLALVFGVLGMMLLNGQFFNNAIIGAVCGTTAFVCGLGAAKKDRADKTRVWEGRIMAALGLAMTIGCLVAMPSAHKAQTRWNERTRKILEKVKETRETNAPPPDTSLEPTAAAPSVSTNK